MFPWCMSVYVVGMVWLLYVVWRYRDRMGVTEFMRFDYCADIRPRPSGPFKSPFFVRVSYY